MKTILVDAVEAFVIEQNGSYGVFEDMYKLLESFPNRKILLTGATRSEGFKKYNLDTMPYEVFTLEHNPEKSDPAYYKNLLTHFNLTKDDVVYFEHNPEAAKSAQSVGIDTYYYDQEKHDLAALGAFLMTHVPEGRSGAVGELQDFAK
jgi:FMN phosphatase YigB (HAD superfamily)